MTNQFNMINGFTVGINDISVTYETNNMIMRAIDTVDANLQLFIT